MRNDGLTDQEGKVMDALVLAYNEFNKLEQTHPSELEDFVEGIHKCQYVLGMRILRRDYPKGYPTYQNTNKEKEKQEYQNEIDYENALFKIRTGY